MSDDLKQPDPNIAAMSNEPAKPESRCTCRHDASHPSEFFGFPEYCKDRACNVLIRCEPCLNQDAEIQRLKEDVAINDDFVAALESKVKSLAPHGTCACDYDKPGDLCAHHSPKLTVAQAEIQRLTQELVDARNERNRAMEFGQSVERPVSEHYAAEVARLAQELVESKSAYEVSCESNVTMRHEHEKDVTCLTDALKVAVEAIEIAPHNVTCRAVRSSFQYTCECWRAKALTTIKAMEGERK